MNPNPPPSGDLKQLIASGLAPRKGNTTFRKAEGPPVPRLSVLTHIYNSSPPDTVKGEVIKYNAPMGREQTYVRQLVIGQQWLSFDKGWLTDVGFVALLSRPTKEDEGFEIGVAFPQIVPVFPVRKGEGIGPFRLFDISIMRIRAIGKQAGVTIIAYPAEETPAATPTETTNA